jgi:hypothetical protein
LIERAGAVRKDLDGVEIPSAPGLDPRGIIGSRDTVCWLLHFFVTLLAAAGWCPRRRDVQWTLVFVRRHW